MAQTFQTNLPSGTPVVIGSIRMNTGLLTIVDNYVTGGNSVPAALFGMSSLYFISLDPADLTNNVTFNAIFQLLAGTLKIYTTSTGVELANAAATAVGAVFPVLVFGV